MSRRAAYWLAETIELLLGVAVVLVMLLYVPWYGMFDPLSGSHPGESLVPIVTCVTILPRLLAVVALTWMIRFYIRPEEREW